jgi:hypothetical protein
VDSLTHASYTWDQTLDPTGNDTDDDGDNLPEQTFTVGSFLLAVSVGDGSTVQTLTRAQIQPLLAEALDRLAAEGAEVSVLAGVHVDVADLPGTTLGLATGNTIVLDVNAAGWGWFVDPTPEEDSEFLTPGDQGEQERMDLLSVIAHELGHLLGMEHEEEGLMAPTLSPGTRNLDLEAAAPVMNPPAEGSQPAATADAPFVPAGALAQDPGGPIVPGEVDVTDETFSSWAEWQQLSLALALSENKNR